ncbi:hypothetical protein AAFF_G00317010 [Aldrovandia affinis]|uniref:Uncharacterized protein n=1 Tax=Aldrovandia affinis TaxID=143900 RepID=A0AAD7R7T0_9TELE|nr:hypothetical protein AAFF_G00317010 [Aldrovandia affinis]
MQLLGRLPGVSGDLGARACDCERLAQGGSSWLRPEQGGSAVAGGNWKEIALVPAQRQDPWSQRDDPPKPPYRLAFHLPLFTQRE